LKLNCFTLATRGAAPVAASRTPTGRLSSAKGDQSTAVISDLNKQITELKVTVDGLEKERDFYFGKLREIEILVQEQLDITTEDNDDVHCIKDIQAILYRTEEGFEVPPEGEEDVHDSYDDETF
jgi:RP/EB family microtubule-associated protein